MQVNKCPNVSIFIPVIPGMDNTNSLGRKFLLAGLLCVVFCAARSQDIVAVENSFSQHIFTFGEIELLEDPLNRFTLGQIRGEKSGDFQRNSTYKPENYN